MLQNSKVEFCAADNPHATPFRIHILASVAEFERNQFSTRTKETLTTAKRRGVKLGNPQYETAISEAVEDRQKIAADRNAGLRKTVAEIAEALNLRGIKTNRGCEFTPTHIHRLLQAA